MKNRKFYAFTVVLLAAVLLLSACERSATKGPIATPTSEGEIPFPVATTNPLEEILKATQTAMALNENQGTATPGAQINTPEATKKPKATSTLEPFATITPGKPETYVIQKGEFLYCLARRFNVNVADLLTLNGMNLNSQPSEGTKIKIPQSGKFDGARALHNHPDTYTVDPGDTIGSIACYYGDVDPYTIYAANGLAEGAALTVGQKLQIP
jgi:LysM repeat protein